MFRACFAPVSSCFTLVSRLFHDSVSRVSRVCRECFAMFRKHVNPCDEPVALRGYPGHHRDSRTRGRGRGRVGGGLQVMGELARAQTTYMTCPPPLNV